jgi:hypothetical protein
MGVVGFRSKLVVPYHITQEEVTIMSTGDGLENLDPIWDTAAEHETIPANDEVRTIEEAEYQYSPGDGSAGSSKKRKHEDRA